MSACKTVSMQPSVVQREAPDVPCAQRAVDAKPGRAPRASEWVEWLPPKPGEAQGVARLSAAASNYIIDVLGVIDKLRGVRAEEHKCLDALQEKGLIRQ